MRMAPTTERRSCAIGWRLAISVMARSSSSRCLASMIESSEITRCAAALSEASSALVEDDTIDPARSPMSRISRSIWSRSSSKDETVCSPMMLCPSSLPPDTGTTQPNRPVM